jgi:S-adenosylmethionine decarboxylase
MIDGYGGSYEKLNDKSFVLSCLQELPERLGMRKLADPEVYFAEGNDKKDPGGWSGFVVIMESHISVHTFPGRGFVSVDVYTCQNNIDKDKIVDYFSDKFDLSDTEVNFVIRGKNYPTENT